jgi:hypothetical protein
MEFVKTENFLLKILFKKDEKISHILKNIVKMWPRNLSGVYRRSGRVAQVVRAPV